MALVEAFAHGLPAIVFGHGAPAEIVEDGATGLHARAVDVGDLTAKLRWAAEHPTELAVMGERARRRYEERFTGERNYRLLIDIYRAAGARPSAVEPALAAANAR
jgi:glycosyltransferase involved in cell wall biosynthesis